MKDLLFLTAHSAYAGFVFRYALTLARHLGASVTLLHVYEGVAPELATTGTFLSEGTSGLDRFARMLRKQELDKLRNFAAKHTPKEFREVPMNFEVRTGIAGDEVLDLQHRQNSELIVMGAKIKNTLGESLFGSLALDMVNRAPCPVLLVPPIAQYMGIHKMVYAANFGYQDEAVIRRLLDWGKAFSAKLHVVHVYQDEKGHREAKACMDNLARNFETDDQLHFELIEGHVAPRLDEYGDHIGADLISTTTHPRGFWGHLFRPSTTRGIASEVEIPILIFKE